MHYYYYYYYHHYYEADRGVQALYAGRVEAEEEEDALAAPGEG